MHGRDSNDSGLHGGGIHVGVVNYNAASHLARCLETLPVGAVASITVLDNASPNRTEREALRAIAEGRSDVTLVLAERNLGFGAGVNRILSSVDCPADDLIWILNPDTTVGDGAALELARVARTSHALVSPVITSSQGNQLWFTGGELNIHRGICRHLFSQSNVSTARETTFITGAAPIARKDVWDTLGGFREDLFLYWEDADLCLRAHRASIRLLVAQNAQVDHVVGVSSKSAPTSSSASSKSAIWYYYMQRNRLLVCRNTFRGRLALALGIGLTETLRFILRAAFESDGRWRKLCAALRGLIDGVRGRGGPRSSLSG